MTMPSGLLKEVSARVTPGHYRRKFATDMPV